MRVLILSGITCLALSAQQRTLTPRELFYAAPPAASGTSAPAAAKPAAKPKPAEIKTAKRSPRRGEARVEPNPPAGSVAEPERTPIVEAAVHTFPLGLRYSLLKRTSSGQDEVDADTVFRAGDRIRVSVESNDSGYLYIVNRGSSGAWNVLFPSPEIAGGDNRIERGRRYEIPSGYTFTFDEQPGQEKLFIIFSRRPEADLEKLIYSLGEGSPRPAPAVKPEREPVRVMLAANKSPIDDMLVGRLRNAYARDLIIEKVDDKTPGPRVEKAVYAVNPNGGADARVVADLTLNHQ